LKIFVSAGRYGGNGRDESSPLRYPLCDLCGSGFKEFITTEVTEDHRGKAADSCIGESRRKLWLLRL
jgi:hypothetical protein